MTHSSSDEDDLMRILVFVRVWRWRMWPTREAVLVVGQRSRKRLLSLDRWRRLAVDSMLVWAVVVGSGGRLEMLEEASISAVQIHGLQYSKVQAHTPDASTF